MASKKKKDGLRLDATGLHLGDYCPSRQKRLMEGTPVDVRGALLELGDLLDPNIPGGAAFIGTAELEWLAQALRRIGLGEDAAKVLRLQGRRTSYESLSALGEIEFQIEDLRQQGASLETALALVASYRKGWDAEGPKPVPPTPAECHAEIDRLKKMLGKTKGKFFP